MMSLIPESYLEPLQWLAEQLQSTLVPDSEADAQVVQKGLILYRQGGVSQLKLEKDGISAVVQDVIKANVRLDLNLLYLSECSCPTEGLCRHQMAVFFQILSQHSSVSTWVDDWRKTLREQKTAKSLGIGRAKDLLADTGQLKPDYKAWSEAFHESFDSIMRGNGEPRHYVISDLFSVYIRRLKAGAPFEQEWKNLYLLIGSLVSFNKLLQLSVELGHDEDTVNRYYRHLFQDLLEDMEDLAVRLSVQSLPFAFDSFIEPLKEDSRSLLEGDSSLNLNGFTYFACCGPDYLSEKAGAWRSCSSLWLYQTRTFPSKWESFISISSFARMRKQFPSFTHMMKPSRPYFFYWLEHLSSQKDWRRMEAYVMEFVAHQVLFELAEWLLHPESS